MATNNITTRHTKRESDLLRLLMKREIMSTKSGGSQDQGFIRTVSFEDDSVAGSRQSPDAFDSFRLSAPSTEQKQVSKPSSGKLVTMVPDASTFWHSHKAAKLFCPEPNESPEDAVNNMIDILERATTHPKHCWSIVKGMSRSEVRMLRDEDLSRVYTKAIYIKETLYLSRSTINEGKPFSFRKCCNLIVQIVGEQVKPHDITAGYTIGEWFRDFRRGRAFTHRHNSRSLFQEVNPLLAFFDDEPDLCKLFKFQLVSNLTGLSAKITFHMFLKNIVPMASSKRRWEAEEVISKYGLDKLQQIHFQNWLKDQDFEATPCPDSGPVLWTYMETVDI